MAFKTQAIKYHTNLVNLSEKSVARLLDLATVSEIASFISSTPSWDSELQQKQWLSLRFYIPVRRVSHSSRRLPIYTETDTCKEGKPHGGKDEGELPHPSSPTVPQPAPAQLPSWGSETTLPKVIPQPLAGLTLNWKRVKIHSVGKILNLSSLGAIKNT